jgi:hypothetical protein
MRVLACLLLLLAAPALQAQMYKCKDERGRWVFSDKPLPGCADAIETPAAKPPAPQSPQPAKSATPQPPQPAKSATPQPPQPAKSATPQPPQPAKPVTPQSAPARTASAAGTARTAQKPAPMTEHEKAHYAAECKSAREQLQWFNGPRGQTIENREARIGQLRQTLSQCPG